MVDASLSTAVTFMLPSPPRQVHRSKPMSRKRDPAAIDKLLEEAAKHHRCGDLVGADAILSRILEIDSSHAPALLAHGNIYAQSGHLEQALESFEKAARSDPDSPAHFAQMGRTLQNLGRLEEAVVAFEKAIGRDRRVPELFFFLGNTHSQHGDYDAAITAYCQALTLRPDFAPASCNLGAIYKEQGKLGDAVHAYHQAINAGPKLAIAHANLGSALIELGEVDAAIKACRRATELAPGSVQGFANLGVALRESGDNEQAISVFRQALEIEPGFIEAHMNLGNALRTLERSKEASACYQHVAQLEPKNAQAHSSQVSLLLESGEPTKALDICESYLAQQPYNCLLQAARSVALHTLEQREQLATFLNLNEIVFDKRLRTPPGYKDMRSFNDALSQHVLCHPSLTRSPASHATRAGQHTGELLSNPRGPMDSFECLARTLLEEFSSSGLPLPFLDAPAANIRMNIWGVVMQEGGHQIPHIHPTAWISGVYYPRVSRSIGTESDSGWIEFGRFGREFAYQIEPEVRTIKPEDGLMLLFPSYLYHRTIPLDSNEPRISIAFDFIRKL